jgi:hypothetical protein
LKQLNDIGRRVAAALLCAGLTLGAGGCQKRVQVPPLPPIQPPVALETPPQPEHPPMIEPTPAKLPPVPVASNGAKPKRERKKPAAKTTPEPPPTQVASVEVPAETAAIGELTAGGEANPKLQQEAADMIAANEKRLNVLSAQMTEEQKAQVGKVKNFQRQAQEALGSGDVEGAKTLAMKAKLLLDDLLK